MCRAHLLKYFSVCIFLALENKAVRLPVRAAKGTEDSPKVDGTLAPRVLALPG